VQAMLGNCARTVKNWMLENKAGDGAKLDAWARELERSGSPPRVIWRSSSAAAGSDHMPGSSGVSYCSHNVTGCVNVTECNELRPMDGVTETEPDMCLL
jgi:hypothetical protein